MRVYDPQGREVLLGAKLGSGGEGDVFDVPHPSKVAAKIYHQALQQEKAAKIGHMASLVTSELTELSAWPIDVLHDRPGGRVIGLLMPKIEGHQPIHFLYGPKSRLQKFPEARWPFLIHTAINMARAFTAIHQRGHVVGDVNHGNLLVSPQATVRFIDCDSFQINALGYHYLCEVGVSTHTPPELQGVSFRTTPRTPNHDAFGMAVLVFQLLFMGRHPFSGAFTGRGDMPIEQAIREGRFAYGPGAPSRQMRQPPGTLLLEAVKPVAPLFERAFVTSPSRRPDASEWVGGLNQLFQSLSTCQTNPAHQYFSGLAACPWCKSERQAGFLFFPHVVSNIRPAGLSFNLATVWQQIQAIQMGAVPPAPSPENHTVRASKTVRSAQARLKKRKLLGWGIAIAAIVIGFGALQNGAGFWLAVAGGIAGTIVASGAENDVFAKAQMEHRVALDVYHNLKKRWDETNSPSNLDLKRTDLARLKYEYERLPEERQRALTRLETERRDRQLEAFLNRFRLDTAAVDGIGYGRKVTLQSFGIETAADVDQEKILAIPGFGPSLTNRVLEWRNQLVTKFVFNPKQRVDPSAVSQVEGEILKRKFQLETALLKGSADLQVIVSQAETVRDILRPQIETAALRLAQANADMAVAR